MGLFDFLKKLDEEKKVTYNGLTFGAPKTISNTAYQRQRQKEIDHLEHKYDLSTIGGINSIPIPRHKEVSKGGVQSVTGKIEYYLMLKAGEYEKAGKVELALACYRKANELMPMSCTEYQRDSYMRLPRYLRQLRRFDEARAEETRLNILFSSGRIFDYGGDDLSKAANRADYEWVWEFMPELCPKSFSAYMRMKNENTDKFRTIVAAAKKHNRIINVR